METVAVVLVGIFGIGGSLILLGTVIAMFRTRDALSRINVFSPGTGLAMPMILAAAYVYTLSTEGFRILHLIMAILGFLALIVVSSVASNVLSRAVYVSGSPVSRTTVVNRLAEPGRLRDAADVDEFKPYD